MHEDTGYSIAAFCKLFYCVPWAVAFSVARASTDSDSCKGPAWLWTHLAIIYFSWSSLGCITFLVMKCFQKSINRKIARFVLSLSFLPMLALGPMVIGLIIAYGRRVECPAVESVLSVWFVLSMILLAIPFLIMSIVIYSGSTSYLSQTVGRALSLRKSNIKSTNVVELEEPLNNNVEKEGTEMRQMRASDSPLLNV